MKVSEVIAQLQKVQAEAGDLPIALAGDLAVQRIVIAAGPAGGKAVYLDADDAAGHSRKWWAHDSAK